MSTRGTRAKTRPDPRRHLTVESRLFASLKAGTLPKELLVCGPAGTGKTFGILKFIHILCKSAKLRVLFARGTRKSLSDAVLFDYETKILAFDSYKAGDKQVSFSSIAAGASYRNREMYSYPNGTEIVLVGLDNPGNALSTAWDIVFINEETEATESAVQTIASRMSRPGRDRRLGYMIGDCNPADPQHWLKKRCDSGHCELWNTIHEANPALHDGTDWTEIGVTYNDRLDKALTGSLRLRLKDGIWAAPEGSWFGAFDPLRHVDARATYDPRLPVYLACDSNGYHNAAVWYQILSGDNGPLVSIFGDYYNDDPNVGAYVKACEIKAYGQSLTGGRCDYGYYDPAAGARLGYDTTIEAEYQRAGLHLQPWDTSPGTVISGLNLIQSLLGDGLVVHPDCQQTIDALANYRRRKIKDQFVDEPDPLQHPYEDLVDCIRGGLLMKWPDGRRPDLKLPRVPLSRML